MCHGCWENKNNESEYSGCDGHSQFNKYRFQLKSRINKKSIMKMKKCRNNGKRIVEGNRNVPMKSMVLKTVKKFHQIWFPNVH